jgi:hypothetical protein
LILVFLAALVTIVGVPSTAGAAHPPTVFGYHVMWSTGTVFLFGIVVGAVALLELIMLVAGARSLTRRRYDARSALATASNGKSWSSTDASTPVSSTNGGPTARTYPRPHEGATTVARKPTMASRVA